MTKTIPTAAQIAANRTRAMAELDTARRARDEAAFAAASSPDDASARKRLAECLATIDTLQAGLDGLDAVEREAKRLGSIDARQRLRTDLHHKEREAHEAIDATAEAFDRMLVAIDELEAAWRELLDKQTASKRAEQDTYPHGTRHSGNAHPICLYLDLVANAMASTLQGELDYTRIGGRGDVSRADLLAMAANVRDRAKRNVTTNIRQQLGAVADDEPQFASAA